MEPIVSRPALFLPRLALVVAAAALAGLLLASMSDRTPASAGLVLPAAGGGFDYQIGGDYTPPAGVRVVTRDRSAAPASGLYNICYLNAFQVQPGEQDQWPGDLLLRDANAELVIDEDWGEVLLDLRTPELRQRVADKVSGWIDGCAAAGFQAVEPDNYDSYTRSKDLLTAVHAKEYLKLLSAHAHGKNLAIGQKNTVELAGERQAVGLDFAVAEECGQYDECGQYVEAFGNNVIVIEYTDKGLATACAGFGGRLSIVRRDVAVSTPGSNTYARKTC
jgi:Glycoside-hydrolase family GH114